MKKVGIITFHNSYNCGSMLESYAMQKAIETKIGTKVEIIDYSSDAQKELYSTFSKNTSIKSIIKNIILLPAAKKINNNNEKYESFKTKNFTLSKQYSDNKKITKDNYSIIVAGSDQIWNIAIKDSSDRYFIDWTNKCRKVAYAPSFGSKRIEKYSNNPNKYKQLINSFSALSVREKNGKKWIKELTGRNAELLIDPTLLFDAKKYNAIKDDANTPSHKYIFFYCPSFNTKICETVKEISKKYKLPVICWSTKSYITKAIWRYGFKLPKYESPAVYLSLIKNAELIITTSFHGTIFSTIYRKKFFTIKNGDMFGDDDRVKTLIEQLGIEQRLIPIAFNDNYNYLAPVNYEAYEKNLPKLRKKANEYIEREIVKPYEEAK